MKIGCLQFAPQVGDVEHNLNRADAVLNRVDPTDIESLDLLVLPEMAFSGYNFKSLEQIIPFLEPSGSGISSLWARTTALKYDCVVAVGYPEKVRKEPNGEDFYNSLIVVNEDGETVANYRKSSLYYTDETWAKEGNGFYRGEIKNLGKVAMGICMDINPYKFQTPWTAFEFGFHVLTVKANLVIISMAWLTQEDARTFTRLPQEPDMETLTYWVQRLEPIIRAEGEEEIIVVFANRCGVEGDTVYAGTSAVLGVQHGEVSVYGLLGRGSKELLVVNTEMPPFAKLVSRPDGPRDADEQLSVNDGMSESAVSSAREGVEDPRQKSPAHAIPPSRDRGAATDDDNDPRKGGHIGTDYFNTPSYASGLDVPAHQGSIPPHQDRTSGKNASAQGGYKDQYQHSPKDARTYRRTASPREGYSPKESPIFRRAASTRDGYSPRFPSPREEFAPKIPSPRGGYSPSRTSSRDEYSPGLPVHRRADSPRVPSSRNMYDSREPSPREWYSFADSHASSASPTVPSGRTQAPVEDPGWGDEGLADLASPTFPEPTPMSMRPKLAISTGPETLPPLSRKEPPRGVPPGNYFSSRDLCTPPETPFDDEPQAFIQQHWVPPSALMYTPEEPEWPDSVTGPDARGQLPGRRPSLGSVPNKTDFSRTSARTVPTRPSSRTQEVKLSDLNNTRHNHRIDQDVPSRHPSRSGNSGGARVPERRPTPAVPERNTPRLKSKRSESAIGSHIPTPRDVTDRAYGSGRLDRRTEATALPAPVQNLRETAFPWNSITIAASPSVFKTEFQRSETFPRSDSHKHQPKSATGWEAAQTRSERDRLKRSKSISAFQHDPTDYLPSPALPVHKAYQEMIYSAIEPATSIDSMWAAAAAASSAPSERHGSVSSARGAALPLDRFVRPDILSPMSV